MSILNAGHFYKFCTNRPNKSMGVVQSIYKKLKTVEPSSSSESTSKVMEESSKEEKIQLILITNVNSTEICTHPQIHAHTHKYTHSVSFFYR